MAMGDYSPGSKWYYAPTAIAPIIFIVLFAISGAVHAYQTLCVPTKPQQVDSPLMIQQ
jgi:hypothetical protein